MTESTPAGLHRTERVLVTMAVSVLGLSLIAIVLTFVFGAMGVTPWPVVVVLPGVGLPIGVILIVAFVIVYAIRRRGDAAAAASKGRGGR